MWNRFDPPPPYGISIFFFLNPSLKAFSNIFLGVIYVS